MSDILSTSRAQQIALVVLRTLVGWHFLYEGHVKILGQAWGRDGAPLDPWTAAGYLKGASGPFASVFHALGNVSWIGTLDLIVAGAIVLVGLSLLLGLFTQAGCVGAILLLTMFYVSAMPLSGLPQPRAEGTYLLVNKNLIELVAVVVVLLFHTGRMAGLDRWRTASRTRPNGIHEVAA